MSHHHMMVGDPFNIIFFFFAYPFATNIYIYEVCLKSSVNGIRKQTKQKIQAN